MCWLISIWANKPYFPYCLNRKKKWNKKIYLIAIDSGQQLGLQHEYKLSVPRLWFLIRNQNTNWSKLLWHLLVFHESEMNELLKCLGAAWYWLQQALCICWAIHLVSLLTFLLPQLQVVRENKPWAKVYLFREMCGSFFLLLCHLSKFCQQGKGNESWEKTCYLVNSFQELYPITDRSLLFNSFIDIKVSFSFFFQGAVHSAFFCIGAQTLWLFSHVSSWHTSSYLCADFSKPVIVWGSFPPVCQIISFPPLKSF